MPLVWESRLLASSRLMGSPERMRSIRWRWAASAFALALAPALVVLLRTIVGLQTLVTWMFVCAIALAIWERLRS